MSRVTWTAPEGRFFDTGLDRGMLYPKGTPPTGPVVATNMFTRPSMEKDGTTNIAIITNLMKNPVPASATNLSAANGATVAYDAAVSAVRVIVAAGGVVDAGLTCSTNVGTVVTGGTYTYTFEVEAVTACSLRISIQGATVTGSTVNSPTLAFTAGEVRRVSFTVTHIASGTPSVYLIRSSGNTAAQEYLVRKMMHTQTGVAIDYFDGTNRNGVWNHADFNVVWQGTVNNSGSVVRANAVVDGFVSTRLIAVWSTKWAKNRTHSMRLIPGGAASTTSITDNYAAIDLLPMGISEGKTYTIHATARQDMVLAGSPSSGSQMRNLFIEINGGGGGTRGLITSTPHANVAGTYEHTLTFTVPKVTGDPVTALKLRFYNGGTYGADSLYWDEVSINEGSKAVPYFDGLTPDTGAAEYAWAGVADQSASTKREILTYAVPWMGLTGCEEQGGEGAASYYIDGRPFLYLPKPKEYQATLRAYTYPDAFAEIMGVAEVADGMYLDSQQGDAFDLSYRTLVGNALEGVEHAYKIHLVYNAVVTPQAMTYDTLGNSVNPVEFSWDIQAVPVRVEGFRPTAHIIIDTRHMSAEKIRSIEDLLYGSEDEIPHMPDPQVIFDILSYGDTIIVTDMGDGTFTVEGSYDNVYMVGPGEFRVDNVDGTNNGDGTFTISSTNV